MKILVTGGAGFIGSNLAKHLLSKADVDRVTVIDDFSTGARKNLDGVDVELVEGSILDESALARAVRGVDSIIHLGAIPSVPRSVANPVASHHANATGTLNVLEAARAAEIGHVVVASSSSVYGANPKLPKDERDWTRPMSPYAVSKSATEGYAIAYRFAYGLDTLAFRFFNVYGPGQAADHAYAAVVPKFVDAALRGQPLRITGDGTQSRDFTYVRTVCEVLYQSARDRLTSEDPLNLAYGTNTSLLDLIDLLERELGVTTEREFVAPRPGDVKASQADSTRVRALFPDVAPVSLQDGLRSTISWFEAELAGRRA